MQEYKIYRCDRCGIDVDTDLSEARPTCRNCGSSRWEANRTSHLLTKRDVFIIYLDTGVWMKNQNGETKLDEIAAIEDTDTQDKAEKELADALSASIDLPFEIGG